MFEPRESIYARLAGIRAALRPYEVRLRGKVKLPRQNALSADRLRATILRYEWFGPGVAAEDLEIEELDTK